MTLERDDTRRRVIVCGEGAVTTAEVLAVIQRQADDGLWAYATLHEATAVTTDPQPSDLRRMRVLIGFLARRHGRRGPVALVTARPDAYDMGRLYEIATDGDPFEFRVFRTRAEAEAWLDGAGRG